MNAMQVKIILLKVVTDVFFYRYRPHHVYYHSVRHESWWVWATQGTASSGTNWQKVTTLKTAKFWKCGNLCAPKSNLRERASDRFRLDFDEQPFSSQFTPVSALASNSCLRFASIYFTGWFGSTVLFGAMSTPVVRIGNAERDAEGKEFLSSEPWSKMVQTLSIISLSLNSASSFNFNNIAFNVSMKGTRTYSSRASEYMDSLAKKVTGDLDGEDLIRVIWLSGK